MALHGPGGDRRSSQQHLHYYWLSFTHCVHPIAHVMQPESIHKSNRAHFEYSPLLNEYSESISTRFLCAKNNIECVEWIYGLIQGTIKHTHCHNVYSVSASLVTNDIQAYPYLTTASMAVVNTCILLVGVQTHTHTHTHTHIRAPATNTWNMMIGCYQVEGLHELRW